MDPSLTAPDQPSSEAMPLAEEAPPLPVIETQGDYPPDVERVSQASRLPAQPAVRKARATPVSSTKRKRKRELPSDWPAKKRMLILCFLLLIANICVAVYLLLTPRKGGARPPEVTPPRPPLRKAPKQDFVPAPPPVDVGGGTARNSVAVKPEEKTMRSVPLRLTWKNNLLHIHSPDLPGGRVEVLYLEAYCRSGSTDRDWHETVIPHKTQLMSARKDGRELLLQCRLADGVEVEHHITSGVDEVAFELEATNRTARASDAHWAQPCMRVGEFTGTADNADKYAYVPHCFIFLDGRLATLPTKPWATKARYTPGQVWCPQAVPRQDVNPRPLSSLVPDNALIGCFSHDQRLLLATAWQPCQELFQGVIRCIHSDFRIGGLAPGERKRIRGRIYILPNDVDVLLARYARDYGDT